MELMNEFIFGTLSNVASFLMQEPIVYFTCGFLLLVVIKCFKLIIK